MRLASFRKLLNSRYRPPLDVHEPVRPSGISHLPQKLLSDCRVLSRRNDLLSAIPKGGIVAELGVADGDFSADILALNEPATLHLVDTWDSAQYSSGLKRVKSRFAPQIEAGSVVIHHGRSIDVLRSFPDKFFDWIYIDTTHLYADTIQELRLSARVINNGGFITGHDFRAGEPYGVIQAVFEFCLECQWQFKLITLDGDGHFSFCLSAVSSVEHA